MGGRSDSRAAAGRLRRGAGVLLSLLVVAAVAGAAPAPSARVQFDAGNRVFRIDAAGTTYLLGINDQRQVQALYWGARLGDADRFPAPGPERGIGGFDPPQENTPLEFSGWGGASYLEPDLKITFPDGDRDLVLAYDSYNIEGSRLNIVLRDASRAVLVTLHYQPDEETGILRRWAEIENRTSAPLTVEQAFSGTWNLPRGTNYQLHYLTGRWAGEWTPQAQPVQPGKVVLESRRGTTGAQNNPWFAIDSEGSNDPEHGGVWFGALGWSGSWEITVEQDALRQLRISGGFNSFDFGYRLGPGARLETPPFYGGYSAEGMNGASRLLHRLQLDSILPQAPRPRPRPVLYNSWEATKFDVSEAGQIELAEKAASIGAERFVVDDGWFGQRRNDHAGLGDWVVNREKFPHGLKPLIDKVHSLGMDFGLWVEPEMVNPDSDLYRSHPDWVLNFPGRPRTEGRNQLVLNLARPDVRDYLLRSLDRLLSENDIAFLKWDYNRNWSEPGWPAVPPEEQKNVYVDFIRNLYSILDELRARHPHLEIESCSGGGSRVDLGILRHVDQVWTSDNTDAFDRLFIQNGFTYAYTPGVMMSWVTDSPTWVNKRSLSLEYRFLSSMQGSLGVGADLSRWTPEDFATARRMIALYKTIRETVQQGALYRLIEPAEGRGQSATEYVARDGAEAVVFAFLHSSGEFYPYPRIRLRGLDPAAVYDLRTLAGKVSGRTLGSASGAYWMEHGVDLELVGDFQAAAFRLEREGAPKS